MAPHAHSEFYQTLGASGIIGVAGLLLYAILLLTYGIRYGRLTNGVALTLVLAMLLRGATEPTLGTSPGSTNFYNHFLLFAFLMLASRQKSIIGERTKDAWSTPISASTRGGKRDGHGSEDGVRFA
jgi:hypothetical protein